jgi:hypothetical protein
MVSGGAVPTSRGLETTQMGGGDWMGMRGPISVPLWKATSS